MTVAMLIAMLAEFPQDAPVRIAGPLGLRTPSHVTAAGQPPRVFISTTPLDPADQRQEDGDEQPG